MARYSKDFQISVAFDDIFRTVHQYLLSEGYEYIVDDGENVFQKGNGFLCHPSFFKLSPFNGGVRLEAWVKFALLPGVYVGEYGKDSAVGALTKGPMKDRLAEIENMLVQCGGAVNRPSVPDARMPMHNNGMQQMQSGNFCTRCGTKAEKGYMFCTNCGGTLGTGVPYTPNAVNGVQPMPDLQLNMPPTDVVVDKREYRSKYVKNFNKDIRNISILCYVCVVINSALAFAMDPYGLIDAGLLLAITLGLHLGKSKVCAYLLLALSIVEIVIAIAYRGSGPYWWLIAAILAVKTFMKADKEYKEYVSGIQG